jgi:uncharacterized membrane protein
MNDNPEPPSHETLIKQRKPIRNANDEYEKKLSPGERFAIWITDRVGTMGFFGIICLWSFVWLGWNTLAPKGLRFDPFPAFVLWLFLSNVIQIVLMPLIMVGQNLQGAHDEARADSEFETSVRAERENKAILLHLRRQHDLLLKFRDLLAKGVEERHQTDTVPSSHEALAKLRRPIRNANVEHEKQLSPAERLAVWITDRVGTTGFFVVVCVWSFAWLGWNTLAPRELRFDPFPAFVFWLFLSNVLQILLMPLIMVGQNVQGWHAEARAESEYEINVQAERETEAILLHLERQHDLILKIRDLFEKGNEERHPSAQ